jgi:hypothetical protein
MILVVKSLVSIPTTSTYFGGVLAVLPQTDDGVALELEDKLLSELTIITNPTKAMVTYLPELGETCPCTFSGKAEVQPLSQ